MRTCLQTTALLALSCLALPAASTKAPAFRARHDYDPGNGFSALTVADASPTGAA